MTEMFYPLGPASAYGTGVTDRTEWIGLSPSLVEGSAYFPISDTFFFLRGQKVRLSLAPFRRQTPRTIPSIRRFQLSVLLFYRPLNLPDRPLQLHLELRKVQRLAQLDGHFVR